MKHIYILGICGTFMGGLAVLAKEMGFKVSGCDTNIYPPMSTQLSVAGIHLDQGFESEHLSDTTIDMVVVGNALSRGNPIVEHLLNSNIPYTSGPQFLHDYILHDKWVLAVSGTHGKTSTSAMLAWILAANAVDTGFLIGGVVNNFPLSAKLGNSPYFVIEADEYDTAFFDKRSKFIHYRPKTLIINNIEFDHADIFDSMNDIYKQFHHLLRVVPQNGTVVYPASDTHIQKVLSMGCWSTTVPFGMQGEKESSYMVNVVEPDGSHFSVTDHQRNVLAEINWSLVGQHNVANAMAAMLAAKTIGIELTASAKALQTYKGVKRRMELLATVDGVAVYDDFAHHPTAIKTSLEGMRKNVTGRLIAVIELASNTMKQGIHKDVLADAVSTADLCFCYVNGQLQWTWPQEVGTLYSSTDALLKAVLAQVQPQDHVILMSNSGFGGFRQQLVGALSERGQ